MAMFGWLKANRCSGDGADSKAVATMLPKSPRHTTFQNRIKNGDRLRFLNPKYATNGAVRPARISKLCPSNVMISGTTPCRKSQYKVSSTGIRTVCKYVNVPKGKLSRNCLPHSVTNSSKMQMIVGRMPSSIILGGMACGFDE